MKKSTTIPKRGFQAHGSETKHTAIRLPSHLMSWLNEQANREGISRSALIIRCIEEGQNLRSSEVKNA